MSTVTPTKLSVGQRIAQARANADKTQDQLAKFVNRGRSAVAQWERDSAVPDINMVKEIAQFLQTTPEYLAFGLTNKPVKVAPSAEEAGYLTIREVTFGDEPDDLHETGRWGVSLAWLRNELGTQTDDLIMFKVNTPVHGLEFGDRVVVDRANFKPSPPGLFLYWDGLGPAIGRIMVLPPQGRKLTVKVDGATGSYEVDASKITIIGRLKGIWRGC